MMDRIYKVCFVCTGNACRSPFAECVLHTLLDKEGMEGIAVLSRGTENWGVNPRDEVMVQVAKELGYELKGTTTPMTYEEMNDMDVIIVFDGSHRNALTRILNYDRWDHIVLFDQIAFDVDNDVMDPHGQTFAFYRNIAAHIDKGCHLIFEKIIKKLDL